LNLQTSGAWASIAGWLGGRHLLADSVITIHERGHNAIYYIVAYWVLSGYYLWTAADAMHPQRLIHCSTVGTKSYKQLIVSLVRYGSIWARL